MDSGSNPLNTAPCEDDTVCIASDEASGQPTTMPSAARMTPCHSWRFGRRLRVIHSRAMAGTAATSARPSPTSRGASSVTASRVMGRVSEKTSTPSKP
ncbi:hypothetical protein D3C72_2076230 [compost metagenome]